MVLVTLLLLIPCHENLNAGEIPSVEHVMKGRAALPTIEDLTGGKVKIGDLINKDNVDLVKEYLGPAVYEAVNMGMVLRMGKQLPPDQLHPRFFTEATKMNKGKAVIDENGTVYYEKMGVPWPGGLPFPEPKSGLEVMANPKFGHVWDDLRNYPNMMRFIDSRGRNYKSVKLDSTFVYGSCRLDIPPVGVAPGQEGIMYKRCFVMLYPLEIKGLGQYVVRYYDDAKDYDTGFAYLPAFKRTIRASATTWQDNIVGSDVTHGDGQGLQEPYSDWSYRLIETKYVLLIEPKSPFPILDENTGELNKKLKFDAGQKCPRMGWCIWPMHVVEATPKIKHIYGRQTLYIHAWPYWPSCAQISLAERYDRQMKLWKLYVAPKGYHYILDGEPWASDWGAYCWDLQADHVTQMWMTSKLNVWKTKPEDVTLKKLLETSR